MNDTYGHDVGDEVIKFLAQQLRSCSRENDILCRSGGEEFLALMPDTPMGSAVDIAERLRSTIAGADFPTVGAGFYFRRSGFMAAGDGKPGASA